VRDKQRKEKNGKVFWQDMFNPKVAKVSLPFGEQTARKLMKVASNTTISKKATHGRAFPPNWTTLYELTKVPEPALLEGIESGRVSPTMQREDVAKWRKPSGNWGR